MLHFKITNRQIAVKFLSMTPAGMVALSTYRAKPSRKINTNLQNAYYRGVNLKLTVKDGLT